MILCKLEKHSGISNLEDIREYVTTMYNEEYVEKVVAMLSVLSQMNLIIDRFYLDNDSDIKKTLFYFKKTYITLDRSM